MIKTFTAVLVSSVVLGSTSSAGASVLPRPTPPPGLVVDAAYPLTALTSSAVDFFGYVSPIVKGQSVTVQRLVRGRWTVISHLAPTATGGLAFRERAPRTAGAWTLRLTRAASAHSKALVSRTIRLRAVKTAFAVTASAPASVRVHSRLTVTGRVAPAASGYVALERRTPFGAWVPWAEARMSSTTAFTITTTRLPPGQFVFRVFKDFSPTVAAGASTPFVVTTIG